VIEVEKTALNQDNCQQQLRKRYIARVELKKRGGVLTSIKVTNPTTIFFFLKLSSTPHASGFFACGSRTHIFVVEMALPFSPLHTNSLHMALFRSSRHLPSAIALCQHDLILVRKAIIPHPLATFHPIYGPVGSQSIFSLRVLLHGLSEHYQHCLS